MSLEIRKKFMENHVFLNAAIYAQQLRTSREIVEYSGCTRRSIERWCDLGYFERYETNEPINEIDFAGGAPTYLLFKISPAIQKQLNKIREDIGRFSA